MRATRRSAAAAKAQSEVHRMVAYTSNALLRWLAAKVTEQANCVLVNRVAVAQGLLIHNDITRDARTEKCTDLCLTNGRIVVSRCIPPVRYSPLCLPAHSPTQHAFQRFVPAALVHHDSPCEPWLSSVSRTSNYVVRRGMPLFKHFDVQHAAKAPCALQHVLRPAGCHTAGAARVQAVG